MNERFGNPSLFERYTVLILAVLGILFFLPFLGHINLFDWDELYSAESTREMLVTGDFLTVQMDFQPFWQKPPFFLWLQVIAMKIFGVNEFAARFPNACFGIITLITFYAIGKRHHSHRFGLIWALIYLGAFIPHAFFQSGIIDPVFNYFIFISWYFLYRTIYDDERKQRSAALAGTSIGLAVLTKGPTSFIILLLTMISILVFKRFRLWIRAKDVAIFTVAFTITSLMWYGVETYRNGWWFIQNFYLYHIHLFTTPSAGHGQPFYYHFVVVFIGLLPFTFFALPSFYMKSHEETEGGLRHWMLALFWVVMILFSISISKIVSYSTLAYLPLSYLAAFYFNRKLKSGLVVGKTLQVAYISVTTLISVIFIAIPFIAYNKMKVIDLIDDPFARACFEQDIHWSGWEFLVGFILLTASIAGYIYLRKAQIMKFIWVVSIGSALNLFVLLPVMAPKVEAYLQGPAIEFYKSVRGEDVYVTTVGFKSYAHYFYFRQPPDPNPQRSDNNYLIHGEIDKPAYFVAKVNHTYLDEMPSIELLYQKGGFKFYKRIP